MVSKSRLILNKKNESKIMKNQDWKKYKNWRRQKTQSCMLMEEAMTFSPMWIFFLEERVLKSTMGVASFQYCWIFLL